MPQINIVYNGHHGPPSLHHESEFGTVHVSEKRDQNKINVFTNLVQPTGMDCFFMQEPITVRPEDYVENNLKKFHKVFTWFTGFNLSNIVPINFPSWLNCPNMDELKNNPQWQERKDEIVIIANPKSSNHLASIYPKRIELADCLHKAGLNVSWYGHTKLNKPYYKGQIQDKIDILKRAKFTLCSENTYHELYSKNYLTEKLPHALFAGCMPIYMGCWNLIDFGIDEGSIIDLRTLNNNSLIERIKSFTESEYNIYRNKIYEQYLNPKGIFYLTSYHTAYDIMLRSV